jgi:hypothetical protein
MPNDRRPGFAMALAMIALGWGYYFLIIFVGLSALAFLQNHALSEFDLFIALFIGALHGIPAAAVGTPVLLAARRLSPNRPALPLAAAVLAAVVHSSFLSFRHSSPMKR